jgi:hypothetical protein
MPDPHSSWNPCYTVGRVFILKILWAKDKKVKIKKKTYHTYQPVENKSCCGVVCAIMEGWYAVMFPAVVALFEVSTPTWVQRTDWLQK